MGRAEMVVVAMKRALQWLGWLVALPFQAAAWVLLYALALVGCLTAIPALWAWGIVARLVRCVKRGKANGEG